MWTPSGAQLGFSFLPSPCVNCPYSLVSTFMVNMLKAPVEYLWVHAKAIRWPSGCHDALEARRYPVSISLSRLHPYSYGKPVADRGDPKKTRYRYLSSDSLLARLRWRWTKRSAETPFHLNWRRRSGNTFPYPRKMHRQSAFRRASTSRPDSQTRPDCSSANPGPDPPKR